MKLGTLITEHFEWVEQRLEVGLWFSRGYVIAATVLVWQTAFWSFEFATSMMAAGKSGIDIAAVIAAVSGPSSLIVGAAFKQYAERRAAK